MNKIITEEEVLATGFKKAKKGTWIWCDDYYLNNINPEYGFFLYCTLHVPTEVWRKGDKIETKMCKIVLHRYYKVEDPTSNWDWSFSNGESTVVYNGMIENEKHLRKLLIDLGINGK